MTQDEISLVKRAVAYIHTLSPGDVNIMEICGTHTHQIAKFGLKKLLPPNIRLISGPGCPVCVTEPGYIDALLTLLARDNLVVATFGDLLRVRGTLSSLESQKALGKSVLTVYSPEEAMHFAEKHPHLQVVFAAVGFETSAPIYAALIKCAHKSGVRNLSFLTALKRMGPAIRYLLSESGVKIDGMLCPGHVAAITGVSPFLPISEEYGIPAVICGFEALDIVGAIGILCRQIAGKSRMQTVNAYRHCVSTTGNTAALGLINEVFAFSDAHWRGIGQIPSSGFEINNKYRQFDARQKFGLTIHTHAQPVLGCDCGDILTGKKTPDMCRSFGRLCTPEHPIGPCMVSSEGACAACYRYGGVRYGADNYVASR